MNIVLLGAPGSGKGTLSHTLKEKLKITHISTGDVLRAEVAKGSDLGKKIKSVIESGRLVDDLLMIELIEFASKNLEEGYEKGFVLDGFPRTLPQAKALESIVKIDYACYLNIDPDSLLKRIMGRRICPSCAEIFNIYSKRSQKGDHCERCGAKLSSRSDDQDEESIAKRLQAFRLNSAPIVDYYRAKKILVEVDSSKDAEIVSKEVMAQF